MKKKHKKKILMAVFNPIEFDGRVKRSAELLSTDYEIIIFCPRAESNQECEINLEADIHRFSVNVKSFPKALNQFLFWLQFILIALRYRPDVVYSHDFYLTFPGFIASRIIKSISIYDAHELIIPTSGKRLSKRKWLFYNLEKISIHKHDLIIAANEERASIMHEYYSLNKKPVPIRNISKKTVGSISQEYGLKKYPELNKEKNQHFIVYMGDIDLKRGLEIIIESLKFLPDSVILILIGDGPDRLDIEKKMGDDHKNRIRLTGIMPQNWIQDVLTLCDIGILVYSMDDLNNYYCSPNKVFEYTHAGLPVVSTAQPPLVNLINNNKIGEIAGKIGEMPTPNDVANSIHNTLERIEFYKKNAKDFSSKNDFKLEGKIMLKEIDNLFKKRE